MATSKQWLGLRVAMIGSGDSPWRPNIAMSRSAASVLVGRPVDGPPRWMSMIEQRQLEADRQAHRLALQGHARPAGGGARQVPAEGGAQGGADAGDLVLGLEGADAEVLVLRQLVEDVGRRGDRVAAQEQRQLGLLPTPRPGPTPARCCR